LLVRRDLFDWQVRLFGFGMGMKATVIHAVASNPAARTRTNLGHGVVRLLATAAPEMVGRLKGTWVGPHSDIYSFARTCWYALTARTNPDAAARESVPEPWRVFLDACTVWPIGSRPAHCGLVAEMLARVPGGEDGAVECEKMLCAWAIADATEA